ncbi:hypothetical protein EV639_103157 [Rathayibacter tanaceti]|uniref:DUF4190 domain-containing protein n=3 Tax=Rathayibacter tanaceti TaxID=1671680 RepID=A0A166HMJ9_9MICO|nr:DUF4190 domain-containing protein [Rathayibacter tanaceti]KZX20871.1 hypothetical protein ACH61_01989 [Rathayibacter tanaceti]QHC54291.1 hypothetical protein GSU10_00530 [Rathayibacter tanaceti]TCO37970.1 hypothetical protein EV639_103157 [Rathayibacter tanaceti]
MPPAFLDGPDAPEPARSRLALATLIVGIAAVPLAFVPFFGAVVGITAIALGIVALVKKRRPRGFALTGLVLGAMGLVLAIVLTVFAVVGLVSAVQQRQLDQSLSGSGSSSASDRPLMSGFDDGVSFDDGVAIGVSSPSDFQVTENAIGADQAHNVVFTFVIKNDSDTPVDPYLNVSVSSGGVEGSRIADYSADRPLVEPSTAVLPGGQISWQQAFSVADPDSVVVQVDAGYDRPKVIFTSVK